MENGFNIDELILKDENKLSKIIINKLLYSFQIPLFISTLIIAVSIFYFRFDIDFLVDLINIRIPKVDIPDIPAINLRWILLQQLVIVAIMRIYELNKPVDRMTKTIILLLVIPLSFATDPYPWFVDFTKTWNTIGLSIGIILALEVFIKASRFGPITGQTQILDEKRIILDSNGTISVIVSGIIWKTVEGTVNISLSYLPVNEVRMLQNILAHNSGTTVESSEGMSLYFHKKISGPFWMLPSLEHHIVKEVHQIQDNISKIVKYVGAEAVPSKIPLKNS